MQANIYSKACTGDGVIRTHRYHPGVRCSECQDLWEVKNDKLKKMIRRRGELLIGVVQAMYRSCLSEVDEVALKSFSHCKVADLRELGISLKQKSKAQYEFYLQAKTIPACNESPKSNISLIKNADPFLRTFTKLYEENVKFQSSLMVTLMHAFCAKVNGHKNPQFPVDAMNFFIASESISRKTFNFISENLLGPGLRSVQRTNAKSREELFIHIEKENIKNRLRTRIRHLTSSQNGGNEQSNAKVKESDAKPVIISISFDGTKVPKALALSRVHKVIIGGAVPNHLISVEGLSDEEVKALLDPDSDVVRADELKAGVVAIQLADKGKPPFFNLVSQAQTINLSSCFNESVVQAILELCREERMIDLASVAADGVGCDNKWLSQQLCFFLMGKQRHLGVIDTNHNAKNTRY